MTTTITYENYKKHLIDKGYTNKLVTLDQDNKDNIFKFFDVKKINKSTFHFIQFQFQKDIRISMDETYTISLYITDKNGIEIPDDAIIKIAQYAPSSRAPLSGKTLARIKYSDIKMTNKNNGYKFDNIIEILSVYHIFIHATHFNREFINIPKKNIKFKMICDVWTKD